MKRQARWLAWLLTLTMIFELLPVAAFAQSDVADAITLSLEAENSATSGTCGDNLTWVLTADGTLTISGTGEMSDYSKNIYDIVTTPWNSNRESIKKVVIENGVTSIGKCAFAFCTNLTSIIIPDSVTSIGRYAFYWCTTLTSITIPDSVTSIGEGAFYHCTSLTSITIPDGVTSIGEDAFGDCTSLTSITIPDSVTSIGKDAFYHCTSLTSITIPDSVTSIGSYAFYWYTGLTSITIPDSVTSIGDSAFSCCSDLTSITIPDSVTYIGNHVFSSCTGLTSITIPDSVTWIYYNTFYGCTSLTSITIPDSVTGIDSSAFYGCTSLKHVYYSGTEAQWNAISISDDNTPLETATIHYNSTGSDGGETERAGFEFGKDDLGFLNRSKDFQKKAESDNRFIKFVNLFVTNYVDEGYPVGEKLGQLTEGLAPRVVLKLLSEIARSWNGSCRGMSTVVLLHYLYPDRIPLSQIDGSLSDGDNIHSLSAPVENESVKSLINYYHLMQFFPDSYRKMCELRLNSLNDFDGQINEIVEALRKKEPILVGMSREKTGGGHAILLLDIAEETDDYYTIDVYDPNYSKKRTLKLYKTPYAKGGLQYPKIEYTSAGHKFAYFAYHLFSTDVELLDIRNYFTGEASGKITSDYDDVMVTLDESMEVTLFPRTSKVDEDGTRHVYVWTKDGLQDKTTGVIVIPRSNVTADGNSSEKVDLIFPDIEDCDVFEMEITSEGVGNADILLKDTMLSVSTTGPIKLTYNENERTFDITADQATDVGVLFTQNTPDESWPWHTYAVDTTGTTTLHAELTADGLQLSGDGLSGAQYAAKNADTDALTSGTIRAEADETTGLASVVIVNKEQADGNELVIEQPQQPGEDSTHTVTVRDGATDKAEAKAGETVTITADTKAGKTFTHWTGNVTFANAEAVTTTFTMGSADAVVTANYKDSDTTTDPAKPTTPSDGGSSGSSGGGSGAGALLLVGAGVTAAAIGVGVAMSMPVDVKGEVRFADHTAVPGAKVSLLQEGNVVAQTTADDAGRFALEVKRGTYELTAAYTDANGRLVHQTISIEAPNKSVVVTF